MRMWGKKITNAIKRTYKTAFYRRPSDAIPYKVDELGPNKYICPVEIKVEIINEHTRNDYSHSDNMALKIRITRYMEVTIPEVQYKECLTEVVADFEHNISLNDDVVIRDLFGVLEIT